MSKRARTHIPAAPLWSALVVVALANTTPTLAQTPADYARAFIAVNGGLQGLARDFSQEVVFPESTGVYREVLSGAAAQETGRFESDYRFRSGPLLDVSGGVRFARRLGFGVGVSRFDIESTASVSAQVPHPIFFERDRSIAGTSTPLGRRETAVHLQALVTLPATPSLTVTVFGGPTLFNLTQQLVTDVRFTHAYPYDTAVFAGATTDRESAWTLGYNFGADVAYYFNRSVGIGWLTRYSRGTVQLPAHATGDAAFGVPAGGLHAVGGLRLRF